jgi:hypothetical protein
MSTLDNGVWPCDTEGDGGARAQEPRYRGSSRLFVEWHGERYNAQLLRSPSSATSLPPLWAVSRGREFIGTMASRSEEAAEEFEIRCLAWLRDLYESRRT